MPYSIFLAHVDDDTDFGVTVETSLLAQLLNLIDGTATDEGQLELSEVQELVDTLDELRDTGYQGLDPYTHAYLLTRLRSLITRSASIGTYEVIWRPV